MPRTKKLPILAVFTWSLTLFKIQDGGQDGDHCWWRHRSFFREDQWLSTEGKIVSKYCNISKTLGRGSITPPPPFTSSLYHSGGMTLRVRQRVKKTHTHTTTTKNTHTPTNWTIRTHTTNQKQTNNNGFRYTKKHPLFLSMFPFELTPRYLKTEIYYDWRFTQFTQLR